MTKRKRTARIRYTFSNGEESSIPLWHAELQQLNHAAAAAQSAASPELQDIGRRMLREAAERLAGQAVNSAQHQERTRLAAAARRKIGEKTAQAVKSGSRSVGNGVSERTERRHRRGK